MDKRQQQQEADLARREKDRQEEMRRREQTKILEVCISVYVVLFDIPVLSYPFFVMHNFRIETITGDC